MSIFKDHRKEVIFFKLGGLWDMIFKDGQWQGAGGIDENTLYLLEKELGFFNENEEIASKEWPFAEGLEKLIEEKSRNTHDILDKLSFVPEIRNFIKGKYLEIYSGDSSHFETPFVAPLISLLLMQAWSNPKIQILGAQGTDTADISLLPLLDVYLFDTNLPAIIFTGANRGHTDPNSDAFANFFDMIRLAQANLLPGAYWVFAGYVFSASDFVKISPMKVRIIDNYSSFYSPHLKAISVEEVLSIKSNTQTLKPLVNNHVSQKVTTQNLFQAMREVHIVNLGEQHEISQEMEEILNPKYKAIIISANSLGNVSRPLRYACIKAAQNNKLVITVSRCLIGEIRKLDYAYMLDVNKKELNGTGKKVLSGHKLNKNVARALAIRAIQEGLNQEKTQELIDRYTMSRKLSDNDVVVI